VSIGPHCSNPFPCDFAAHCWQHVPRPSVFDVSRIGSKAWQYYHQGTVALADLDENQFTSKAKLQIEAHKTGKEVLRKDKVSAWLETADYPLYFLDFETVGLTLGVPVYQETGPYQQVPVQYSLHIVEQPGAEPKHLDFLPDFSEDPRRALAKELCAAIGEKGSIIAYNQIFEAACLNHLAEQVPQLAPQLKDFADRLLDLIIPFRSNWVYTPAMGKSASIKAVYPALFPEDAQAYQGLVINNGGDASLYLAELAKGTYRGSEKERTQLFQDLKAYCALDTLAMVKIWRYLDELKAKN
jgi:hypothetical protein